MANGDINNGIITPNKKSNVKKNVPPVDDTRNDLLKAIRDGEWNFHLLQWIRTYDTWMNDPNSNVFLKYIFISGIKLRKVEKSEQKDIERSTALHDVASILARRVAIELSESEDSDSDDDSEGWVEQNETNAWPAVVDKEKKKLKQ